MTFTESFGIPLNVTSTGKFKIFFNRDLVIPMLGLYVYPALRDPNLRVYFF